jgi:hypothetical protein
MALERPITGAASPNNRCAITQDGSDSRWPNNVREYS